MPIPCSIIGCEYNNDNPRDSNGEKISVFPLPQNPQLREKWLKIIPLTENVNTEKFFICSKHFDQTMFKTNTEENLNVNDQKSVLKKDAVPTIFYLSHPSPSALLTLGEPQLQQQQLTVDATFVSNLRNDKIENFDHLKANIRQRLHLKDFQLFVDEKLVSLYKVDFIENVGLKIVLSMCIDENLVINIYEQYIKHSLADFKSLIANTGRIYFYSQLQKLIDKSPPIKCVREENRQ